MQKELQFALDAVREAAIFTKRLQQERPPQVFEKADQSPVTIADYGSQLLVTHYLQVAFPNDRLVAEESIAQLAKEDASVQDLIAQLLYDRLADFSMQHALAREEAMQLKAQSGRYWVLDPIDGTKGFLRGDQFAIALALIEQGTPVLGVVGCPNLNIGAEPDMASDGILAWAVKGQGAWIEDLRNNNQPARLAVSACSDPSQARFVSSLDSSGHSNTGALVALKNYLNNPVDITQYDSQAKYVMVAAGKFELFVRLPPANKPDYHEKVWDHAAGALIVEEAGGLVTDVAGLPFDYSVGRSMENNHGVIVSNGRVHPEVVAFFRKEAAV